MLISGVSSSGMDPFKLMHNKTVELLSAKVADYALPSPADDAVNLQSDKDLKNMEELLDLDTNVLYSHLSDLYAAEKENTANSMFEESAEIALLHSCKKNMEMLKEHYDKCIESSFFYRQLQQFNQLVKELRSNYEKVTERTSSLHNACDRMMAHQTQIAAGAEQIRANLYYYTQYESVMKKLKSGNFSITGQVFTQILSTIDDCLRFLNSHIHYKDSKTYIAKYEQCLSKAMTVIKMGVIGDLESSQNAVKDRQMKLDMDNHQTAYSDDDIFALLYGVFAARANSVRSALNVAEQHFREITEFQMMVADCQQTYFKIRYQMLESVIRSTIEELTRRHENSSCAVTRNGCVSLLRLCDDEFRLYKQFFTIADDNSSGSRSIALSTPSSPHTSVLASFISGTTSFDDFIESLCRVFYDILRPIIIHNPHLETLTELCTILKVVEMIEERCGLIQSVMSIKGLTSYVSAGESSTYADEYVTSPRNGFVRVMTELVGDVAERIVYRTSLYAQSDIAEFSPSSGDLAYPEKLEMMKEIEKEHTSGKDDTNAAQASAVSLYCLWYPTVRRTVLCLSKLFKCLEPVVFQSIARELLIACCQSLEHAAKQIRNRATEKFSRTRRLLDAELFVVKHLLILREQTSPYRVTRLCGSASSDTIPQRDYVFDLSKYKISASQLFHDRHRWFELTSNNVFLEFLLQVPLAVTEAAGDSRRIIDVRLKTHCHNLINAATDMIILEFADYITKAEEAAATPDFDLAKNDSLKASSMQNFAGQAYKKLTHLWPEIKQCFDLYISFKETEDILLQPVKKRIIDIFTRANVFVDKFYDNEQKQIAGLPNQEHIWLKLGGKKTWLFFDANIKFAVQQTDVALSKFNAGPDRWLTPRSSFRSPIPRDRYPNDVNCYDAGPDRWLTPRSSFRSPIPRGRYPNDVNCYGSGAEAIFKFCGMRTELCLMWVQREDHCPIREGSLAVLNHHPLNIAELLKKVKMNSPPFFNFRLYSLVAFLSILDFYLQRLSENPTPLATTTVGESASTLDINIYNDPSNFLSCSCLGSPRQLCEKMKYRRETYYRAMDMFDRLMVLVVTRPIKQEELLNLANVMVFLASKIEEGRKNECRSIMDYIQELSPSLSLNAQMVFELEFRIIDGLKWSLRPITALDWAKIYMHMMRVYTIYRRIRNFSLAHHSTPSKKRTKIRAATSDDEEVDCLTWAELDDLVVGEPSNRGDWNSRVAIAQVLDLCTADLYSFNFTYRQLGAAAFVWMSGLRDERIVKITGFQIKDLRPAIDFVNSYGRVYMHHIQKGGFNILFVENDPLDDFDKSDEDEEIDVVGDRKEKPISLALSQNAENMKPKILKRKKETAESGLKDKPSPITPKTSEVNKTASEMRGPSTVSPELRKKPRIFLSGSEVSLLEINVNSPNFLSISADANIPKQERLSILSPESGNKKETSQSSTVNVHSPTVSAKKETIPRKDIYCLDLFLNYLIAVGGDRNIKCWTKLAKISLQTDQGVPLNQATSVGKEAGGRKKIIELLCQCGCGKREPVQDNIGIQKLIDSISHERGEGKAGSKLIVSRMNRQGEMEVCCEIVPPHPIELLEDSMKQFYTQCFPLQQSTTERVIRKLQRFWLALENREPCTRRNSHPAQESKCGDGNWKRRKSR
uniref:Conserved oligomeric Golgi complex subunit 3 n=1 Tax=Setaria digitata TaxID=48799 RepID=A0A915PYV8_9BILA